MSDEEELDLDQQLEALDLDANFLDSGTFDGDDDVRAAISCWP